MPEIEANTWRAGLDRLLLGYAMPMSADEQEDLFELAKFSNQASGGLLFPMILLAIWAVAFIGSIAEGGKAIKAWIFSTFVASILAILLGVMGLLENRWIYLLILFVAFGLFWVRLKTGEST